MPFFPHLTVTTDAEKRELLAKFVSLDEESFLAYLYPLLSETQWDRIKEAYIQTIIIYGYGGEGKSKIINQLIADTASETDNLNLIYQAEKAGIFQVYTYGAPHDNRFIFVRLGEDEVKSLAEEVGDALIVRFMVDPEK